MHAQEDENPWSALVTAYCTFSVPRMIDMCVSLTRARAIYEGEAPL